jgi:hypothetical protein
VTETSTRPPRSSLTRSADATTTLPRESSMRHVRRNVALPLPETDGESELCVLRCGEREPKETVCADSGDKLIEQFDGRPDLARRSGAQSKSEAGEARGNCAGAGAPLVDHPRYAGWTRASPIFLTQALA